MHVNAHATSTPAGDIAELKALRKVFGDDADHFAVSATKSMTGHLLGGAGGVESVATVLALYHRVAPPTINVENLDPEANVDIVRGEARKLPVEGRIAALNDSFGFGGHNVCWRSARSEKRPYAVVRARTQGRAPASRGGGPSRVGSQTTWCSQRTGAPSPAYRNGSSSSSQGLPRSLESSASRSVSPRWLRNRPRAAGPRG